MAIVVGADLKGTRLKDVVKNFLVEEGFEVIDVTKDGQDFVDVTLAVASEVNKDEQVMDCQCSYQLLNICQFD